MLNKTRSTPLAAHDELVVQNLKDELLIYNLQTNQAMSLNQTAALVWKYCDGKRDISEITRKLEEKLGTSANEELVLFAIRELNKKGLIENGEGVSNGFEGLSRREIVRRVGFASMVALPIVLSIAAPKASSAQTQGPCVANPGLEFTCNDGTNTCCSNCCFPLAVENASCRRNRIGFNTFFRCTCTCR